MRFITIVAIVVFSRVSAGHFSASEASREVILLNTGWKFILGEKGNQYLPGFNDRGWQTVNVPHDASIYGPFVRKTSTAANGWRPFQQGWYPGQTH